MNEAMANHRRMAIKNSKKDTNISDAVMHYLSDRTDGQLLELLVSMLDEASEKGINLDTIKRIRERSNEKGYRQRRSQKMDDLKQEISILEQTKEELHEKCQRLEQEVIPLRTAIFTSHPNDCECNNFIKSTEFLNF
uniref:Uncharacterized protein n=1 Tax=Acrobeloides nanus TaxID=290746 RepID=A0A914DCI6_9BILA